MEDYTLFIPFYRFLTGKIPAIFPIGNVSRKHRQVCRIDSSMERYSQLNRDRDLLLSYRKCWEAICIVSRVINGLDLVSWDLIFSNTTDAPAIHGFKPKKGGDLPRVVAMALNKSRCNIF